MKENGYSYTIRKQKIEPPDTCGIFDGPLEATVPYFLTDHTISLIDNFTEKSETFFIWHNYWGPHQPYYPTPEYYDMYKDIKIPQWHNFNWPSNSIEGSHQNKIYQGEFVKQWDYWEEYIRLYYAFMTLIDDQIGRLMQYLDKKGILDNTIIIFTADHGETIGSHGGILDKGFHHFEEAQRIPFIVRLPDKYRSGDVIKEFVSLVDVSPTILDAANIEYDKDLIDGSSILPLIYGDNKDWREDVVVEFNGLGNILMTMRTIRWKNYKYGYTAGCKDQLYDLDKDPYEMENLADNPNYKDILNEMKERLLIWMGKTCDPILIPYKRFGKLE